LKFYHLLKLVLVCVLIAGCGGVENPNTDQVLGAPLGGGGLSPGMAKGRVEEMYGEPDIKSTVNSKEWNEPREEWFYRARYDVLPVNAGYLSEDLYLYFDGENLTNISKKPLGKKESDDINGVIK
jgi:hypothetical protein